MKTQRMFLAASAALVLSAAAAFAFRPVPAPVPWTAGEAEAAVAAIDDWQASARQGASPAQAGEAPWKTVYLSQDNVRAIELAVIDTATRYYVMFRPFAVPPAYQGHFDQQAVPVYGLVRRSFAGNTTDYVMHAVGDKLIASIPKSDLAGGGYQDLSVGAWEAGTNWSDPERACFWMHGSVMP